MFKVKRRRHRYNSTPLSGSESYTFGYAISSRSESGKSRESFSTTKLGRSASFSGRQGYMSTLRIARGRQLQT